MSGCECICPVSIWVFDGSARPLEYPREETSIKGGPADPSAPGSPPEVDFPYGAEGARAGPAGSADTDYGRPAASMSIPTTWEVEGEVGLVDLDCV